MSEDATLDEFVNEESNSDASKDELMTSLDETSVGNIPSDWSAVRLGELTKDTLYGANESAEDYDPDRARYIRIKDIDERGRLKDTDKASLSPEKAEGYLLNKGDILFARSGSPGRTYLHRHESGEYCYGGYSIKHEFISEGLNYEYLSQYTKSQKYWDWIERIARTGAQANINSREYASLLVPLPSLPEQRKIATVLYNIDQAIDNTEKIISQTKRIKKGFMQNLFTQGYYDNDLEETRLGPIKIVKPSNWDVVELQDVSEVSAGYAFDSSKFVQEKQDSYQVIKMGNVSEGSLKLDKSPTFIKKEGLTRTEEKYILDEGDILITLTGTVNKRDYGKVGLVDKDDSYVLNQRIGWIKPKNVNPTFLHTYVQSDMFRNIFFSKGYGGTGNQENVSVTALSKMDIVLPPIEEQNKIGDEVLHMNKYINNLFSNKNRLNRIKNGLMQDLLSGKVRTTDTKIEVPEEVAQYG